MGDAVGGGSDGFDAGVFVTDGAGGGASSGVTKRVGEGSGGFLLLLFEFAFPSATGLNSSSGEGETAALTFAFASTFALTGATPPTGIPSSLLPVGGWAGCTG